MQNVKTEGFVVGTVHYNETSEIVHLLTKNGLYSIMCVGARRYKSGKLSFCVPLTKVSCIVQDSSVPRLVDYTVINNYDYIKNDLKKNLWFSFLFEFLNNIPPNSYYKNIYRLTDKILEYGASYNHVLLVSIFLIKMLKVYGVEPSFNTCVVCNSKDVTFFSNSLGGASCKYHTAIDSKPFSEYDIIKELYYLDIYNNNLDKYETLDYKALFEKVKSYYEYHVDINLKMVNTLLF